METRRDWAVILARGDSRRMGKPKGTCRLSESGPTLLEAVAGLYAAAGLPRAVVTTPALAALYRPLLAGGDTVWIERPAGYGTAASVAAALEDLAGRATHLWLHPVDLPEVRPWTLALLRRRSREEPDAALVPAWRGAPGHPVVLPVAPWLGLRGSRPEGAMRELLRDATGGAAVREVPVDDPGVVADRDTPGDLRRVSGHGPERDESVTRGGGPERDEDDEGEAT